jgi:hypothetical protein
VAVATSFVATAAHKQVIAKAAKTRGIDMFATIILSTIAAVVAMFAIALWSDAAAFLREDATAH